jgi:hypothetical protein
MPRYAAGAKTTLEQYEAQALRWEQVSRGYRLDMRRPGQTTSQLDCLLLRVDEAALAAETIRHLRRALKAACCEVLYAEAGDVLTGQDDAKANEYLAETADDPDEPSCVPPPSSPPGPVSRDVTQIACASCCHTYTFSGRPQAEDIAEVLERAGWEFRLEWVCPKCKESNTSC